MLFPPLWSWACHFPTESQGVMCSCLIKSCCHQRPFHELWVPTLMFLGANSRSRPKTTHLENFKFTAWFSKEILDSSAIAPIFTLRHLRVPRQEKVHCSFGKVTMVFQTFSYLISQRGRLGSRGDIGGSTVDGSGVGHSAEGSG